MKRNNFLFGIVLTLSILLTVWCFDYADAVRGYDATGGEVFVIMLPLLIVANKISKYERQFERLEKLLGIYKRNEVK